MLFLMSKTYEVVSYESAEIGDFEETGFEFENRPADIHDVLSELEECFELSCWPVSKETCAGVWASTEPSQDMHTGDYTSYNVHIERFDGKQFKKRNAF